MDIVYGFRLMWCWKTRLGFCDLSVCLARCCWWQLSLDCERLMSGGIFDFRASIHRLAKWSLGILLKMRSGYQLCVAVGGENSFTPSRIGCVLESLTEYEGWDERIWEHFQIVKHCFRQILAWHSVKFHVLLISGLFVCSRACVEISIMIWLVFYRLNILLLLSVSQVK